MAQEFTPNKIRLDAVTHSVRAAQAVLQYGVGAMVDFPSQTLMTAAPERWDDKNVRHIYDERLQKILGVDYFGSPVENSHGGGIGYVQFPRWYFCPQCRRFAKWEDWFYEFCQSPAGKNIESKGKKPIENFVRKPVCPFCRGKQTLVVSRIVVACSHGHIDDFPWQEWCHLKSGRRPCGRKFLTLSTSGTSSEGLESIQVKCLCGAKANLKGIFSKNIEENDPMKELGLVCQGNHPWKLSVEQCGEPLKVLQRGSSSVYFPATFTSLVIPPYSSNIIAHINNSQRFKNLQIQLKTLATPEIPEPLKKKLVDKAINEAAEYIAEEIGGVRLEDVSNIIGRILKGNPSAGVVVNDKDAVYRQEEYDTLVGCVKVVTMGIDDDFRREETNVLDYDLPGVKQVVLIPKIREVQALIGYSRISPVAGFAENPDEVDGVSKLVSVKEKSTNWYPGYEVRGEGIFVEFDRDWFDSWESRQKDFVSKRVDLLQQNYLKSFAAKSNPDRKITCRYLFLHTLSHLLMKRLSFECGYNIASLKERLYCGEKEDGHPMFGLFIYTATGDSEGTLGGLVRQGKSDRFRSIFIKAIESAVTCSNDPVCNLSCGQGRDALNLSACYACSLVPETSCEDYNTLLDRGVLIGTIDNQGAGVYSEAIITHGWHSNYEKKATKLSTTQQLTEFDGIENNLVSEDFKSTVTSWVVDGIKYRRLTEEERNNLQNGSYCLFRIDEDPGYRTGFLRPGVDRTTIWGVQS